MGQKRKASAPPTTRFPSSKKCGGSGEGTSVTEVPPPQDDVKAQLTVRGAELEDVDNGETHKSWVYTWFFKDEEKAVDWLKSLDFKRHVASTEVCPTTGTRHIQGEFTGKRAYRFGQLKKLNDEWRVAPAKCLKDSNYCRKYGSKLVVDIDDRKQGARTDLAEARLVLKTTDKMREVVDIVTSSQAIRSAEIYLKYKEKPRDVAPIEVHWYFGKPGTGKTKRVYELESDVFRPVSFKWWEGYDAHEAVLLDDFRSEWCTYAQLLNITDIYPFRVECKGGSRQVKFKKLYITSCKSPLDCFATEENINQLLRRITTCLYYDENGTEDKMEFLKKTMEIV